MSTSTLPRTTDLYVFGQDLLGTPDGAEPSRRYFERDEEGVSVNVLGLSGVAIFRDGTFRDSRGYQRTWVADDMEAFVTNFNDLKSRGVFPDVPVRKGHPQFGVPVMEGLIGYITALRTVKSKAKVSGTEYTWLVADYEILDETAQKAIASKLWRNRSAEVGVYEDNGDVPHAPVLMGFAYVDIPAVEGLNEFSKSGPAQDGVNYSLMTEEVTVNTSQNGLSGGTAPIPQPPAPGTGQQTAPAAPAPFAFQLAGTSVTDPAQVQSYVSNLEAQVTAFQTADAARRTSEREAFVNSLFTGDTARLPAAQLDSTMKVAKGFKTDEEFNSWKSVMESIPPNPMFQAHGPDSGSGSTAPVTGAQPSAEDQAFANSVEVITRLAKIGTPEATLKAHPAYGRIIAKNPNWQIPAPAMSTLS